MELGRTGGAHEYLDGVIRIILWPANATTETIFLQNFTSESEVRGALLKFACLLFFHSALITFEVSGAT